jgi:4-hydroxybenzoate polyprenyltransferase
MQTLSIERVAALAVLGAGSICLVAHVFVLNDWSGMNADFRDPNRAPAVFSTRGVSGRSIGHLSIALLILSMLLMSSLGVVPLVIALMIAGLSALYSAPAAHLKGVPVLSSVLHLAGGVLHFLLGYSVFTAVDGRGLMIGCFFALIFAAGHLTHETRDSESDLLNRIRTNAVTFGKARSFTIGLALFTIADLLLVVLAARRTVPRPLIIVAALYPLHLYWSLQALRAGLTFESIRSLQIRYRALYAAIGLMTVVTVLMRH